MRRNVFTEEGRTRLRNFVLRLRSYSIASAMLGLLACGLFWWFWTWAGLRPLERIYFRQFTKATVKSLLPSTQGKYLMLVSDVGGRSFGLTDELAYPVRDEAGMAVRSRDGYVFRPYPHVQVRELGWRWLRIKDAAAKAWFEQNIYGDSLPGLFAPALIVCLVVTVAGTGLLLTIDQLINKKYEEGERVRGNRLIEPWQYEQEHKDADGLALSVKSTKRGIRRLVRWITGSCEPTWQLRMRRHKESQGCLILGDSGSGKTQILHRYLRQIARRPEGTAIVYDPARQFVKAHYNPQRGDVILNPLDARSPFWSPVFECRTGNKIDYMTLADCFFPGRGPRSASNELFFNEGVRDIFAHLLEFHPDPKQLVTWLANDKHLDQLLAGSELAHNLDPKAGGMRGGMLATLAKVGKTLRLLPGAEECESSFSISEWVETRRGWIFLTSTKETEERLRPLYTAYLDLLMRRLMSVDEEMGAKRPINVVLDEVHTLEWLPTLYKVIVEGRKFGLHLIQGTQNKAQYEARYGEDATTMLSSPQYMIVLRCKEPGSGRWLSEYLGGEEIEKPRTSVTASVNDQGRDSMNYAMDLKKRALIIPEEIASLPDMSGYWKDGDAVVPFRFDFRKWRNVAEGFIQRESREPQKIISPVSQSAEDIEMAKEEVGGNVWERLQQGE